MPSVGSTVDCQSPEQPSSLLQTAGEGDAGGAAVGNAHIDGDTCYRPNHRVIVTALSALSTVNGTLLPGYDSAQSSSKATLNSYVCRLAKSPGAMNTVDAVVVFIVE